jgi:starch synthase
VHRAGLSYDGYYPGGPLECYDSFCFLKTGLVFADAVSTVSKTYARQIQTPECGEGLDGVLRSRRDDLFGILNGIDVETWNPASDHAIPHPYDRTALDKKARNKQALLQAMKLPYDEQVPTVGIVSRLVYQKGFELLQPIMDRLMAQHRLQMVVLGSGERYLEDFFRRTAAAYPERVAVTLGYNDGLTHLIEAGADMFLMPSRYEPCGLNQMYSMAYGTVPIVHRTGGLADTVLDCREYNGGGNGFSFAPFSPAALQETLVEAFRHFEDKTTWRHLMLNGMSADFSWDAAARGYLDLYDHALRTRRG